MDYLWSRRNKRLKRSHSSRDDLEMLMKRYQIKLQPPLPSDEWPIMHKSHFSNIRKLGEATFDNYSTTFDNDSEQEPWKLSIKHRASFIAARANRLCNQGRNEEGWRLNLENEVFRRFTVEVACPKCRARIWRSEIEAAMNETDDSTTHLAQRRANRKACECPSKHHYSEPGISPLFDDRAEQAIIYDVLNRSQLPGKVPDRVYGLLPTGNFERELLKKEPGLLGPWDGTTVAERVQFSPFKEGSEPLLFPFLILEAKSVNSRDGFYECQVQTAFPIFALLRLQEDLKVKANASQLEVIPLVWFFANRGDEWRVYACSVTYGTRLEYNIMQLWDGCILDPNKSLQLILIVDYIFDWARDIYRPAMLKLLKSIARGTKYEQISQGHDSDIFSMRQQFSDAVPMNQHIAEWLPITPSALVEDFTTLAGHAAVDTNQKSLSPAQIPNTMLGSLRSAFFVTYRSTGIFIAAHNVWSLLRLSDGESNDASGSNDVANALVSFLTKWNELIILRGEDIDFLENNWTRTVRNAREKLRHSTKEQFYFLAEFAAYMDTSWHIVRELRYVAISVNALGILLRYVDNENPQFGIEAITQLSRPCSSEILLQSIKCLRSGSINQIFMSALSCTSLSIYAMPVLKGSDGVPPTELLGFGEIRRPRLLKIIQSIEIIERLRHPIRMPSNLCSAEQEPFGASKKRRVAYTSGTDLTSNDQSVIRKFTAKHSESDAPSHSPSDCEICKRFQAFSGREPHHLASPEVQVFSEYGLCLVVGCNQAFSTKGNHDICLFVSNVCPKSFDINALAGVVNDLLQRPLAYHTICHPRGKAFDRNIRWRDQLWNVPSPYRPVSSGELMNIVACVEDLAGIHVSAGDVGACIDKMEEEFGASEAEH